MPKQTCITRDNVSVDIDGVLYLQVITPEKSAYGISDYEWGAIQLAQTSLRSVIGKLELDSELAYNWYRDMLTVFDEFNIAWTTWCYDADFGFWDQQRHTYKDRPLVELLMSGKGLK